MFKRYVLGYKDDNRFIPISKSNDYLDLVCLARTFNDNVNNTLRFVVFDRKERIYIYN